MLIRRAVQLYPRTIPRLPPPTLRSMSSSTPSTSREQPGQHRPIVLCGPSGVGKSTLLQRLLTEFPGEYGFSVSHTTRSPRPGETPGIHYHYVSRNDFESLISQGEFLEHATFGGNMYGTTAKAVQAVSADTNQTAILDIDAQGVKLLKQNHAYLDPFFIFISPPNLEALYKRLKGRGTETPQSVLKRLAMAKGEIEYARQGDGRNFDVVVVNDDIDRAYGVFKRAVRERCKEGDQLPSDEEGVEERVLEQARSDVDVQP